MKENHTYLNGQMGLSKECGKPILQELVDKWKSYIILSTRLSVLGLEGSAILSEPYSFI